jgi:hypothetical protein
MCIDDVLDAESKGLHLKIEKHFLHWIVRGPLLRDVPIPNRNHSGGPVFIPREYARLSQYYCVAIFSLIIRILS